MRKKKKKLSWSAVFSLKLMELAKKQGEMVRTISDNDIHMVSAAYRDAQMRYTLLSCGKDGRGSQVYFCYTRRRDTAGYYRSWKEVHTQWEIKRFKMSYFAHKVSAQNMARRRYKKYLEKQNGQSVAG